MAAMACSQRLAEGPEAGAPPRAATIIVPKVVKASKATDAGLVTSR